LSLGEEVWIKGYPFKVVYIGETSLLFEPAGPLQKKSAAACVAETIGATKA
jgi:hypothetical protein